jgi:tetratricopeptide (TPR) repeat protein
MSKQWIKQQVKHNEVEDLVTKTLRWGRANQQAALLSLGGVLGALLLGGLLLYKNKANQNAAWDRLSVAQVYAYSGRPQESVKQIEELAKDFSGAKAVGFAQLFAGDVEFRLGSYDAAVAAYGKLLERNDPPALVPFALANTASAQEAGGKSAEAAATAQRFLDAYGDHFLAPQVHAVLGRVQLAQGQGEQAKATFQKMSLQYADTPWGGWAQAQLQSR